MQLTKFNWNRSSEFIIALKLNYTRKRSEDLVKVKTNLMILHATYQEISNLNFLE